jgi:hypothetical protein
MKPWHIGKWVYREDTQKFYQVASYREQWLFVWYTIIEFTTPTEEFENSTGAENWELWSEPSTAGHQDVAVQLAVSSPVTLGGASIYHWDGTTRTTQSSVSGEEARGIFMYSATDGWAVGDNADVPFIRRWNGSTWDSVTCPFANGKLYGVWAQNPSEAYACGYDSNSSVGVILEWNGTAWSINTTGTARTDITFKHMIGISTEGIIGAIGYYESGGVRNAKGFYNVFGGWYSAGTEPTNHQFRGGWGTWSGNSWWVGSDWPGEVGSIHYYDGATFTKEYDGTGDGVGVLNAVWGTVGDGKVWAVGEDSALLLKDGPGASWVKQSFPVAGLELASIWGYNADVMYIVGYDGISNRYIFQTKDGGNTWITRNNDSSSGDPYWSVGGPWVHW